MSLVQFLRILMARRWMILATLLSCVVVALAVASVLPKRYPATARVMLDVVKPDPVTGQMIAGGMMGGYTRTQTELVTDYRVAGEVVDKLGMTSNPTVIARWQADTGGVGDMRRWAAQQISDNTNARMVDFSNIMEIQFIASDPVYARSVAAMLREAYIDATLRFRTDSAGRTAEWYRDQAEKARRQLLAAEAAKSAFEKANNLVILPTGIDPESAKLQSLQDALMAARGTASQAQMQSQLAVQGSNQVDQVNTQLADVENQLEVAEQRYGTAHPTYKALVSRKAALQKELARETEKARSLGGGVNSFAQGNITTLTNDYNAQKQRVMAMQDTINQLMKLQREVNASQERYDKAAARTADLRLQADVSESGLVVLGDVVGSNTPSFPNIPLIGSLAVIFGLMLGIVLALVAELLARRVRGAEDLAFASKAPVLAVIAENRKPSSGLWQRITGRFRPQDKADWQAAQ
jgi:polysaccharide biosynthesis transport protein